MWSDREIGRPENQMTGVSFSRGGYHRIGKRATSGAGAYTLHRADHWLFEGTGLDYGDLLGAEGTVVGYECDGCTFTYRDGLPHPTHEDGTPEGFTILGTAPGAALHPDHRARPPPDQPAELSSSPPASPVAAGRRRTCCGFARSRRARHLHLSGRGRGGHLGQHQLGPRPHRHRPHGRAGHPQRARSTRFLAGFPATGPRSPEPPHRERPTSRSAAPSPDSPAYASNVRHSSVVPIHTTDDPSEWGAPLDAAQVIAHTNMYWNWSSAPGRSGGSVPTAEVDF